MERENIVLTFLATPQQIELVRKEISNQFPESVVSSDVKEKALKRIRLVQIVCPIIVHKSFFHTIRIVTTFKSTDNKFNVPITAAQTYSAAYETLYQGRPLICATTGEVFDAVPPPVAVIIDVCILCSQPVPRGRFIHHILKPLQQVALSQLRATRALSGTSVPIIAVVPGSASSFLRYFPPPSVGGVIDFKSLDDEAARLGVSSDELAEKVRYPPVTKRRGSR